MSEGSSYLHLDVLLFDPVRRAADLPTGRFIGALSTPIAPRAWTRDVAKDIQAVLTVEMAKEIACMPDGTLFAVPKPPHPNGYPLLFVLQDDRLT